MIALCVFVGACGPPRDPFPPVPWYLQRVAGSVVSVDQRTVAEQMAQGVRVKIQPAGSPLVVVDLAPGWYLHQQGIHFAENDRLIVEGSVASDGGVLRAQRVTKGQVSAQLRDEQGRRYWDPAVDPVEE
jgi:hypothetical protein